MPYKMSNPPDWLKSLPKGAQKIGIKTFNTIVADGGNEEDARKAAWSNIKNKYKKVGDKWVKKSSSQESFKLNITGTPSFVRLAEGAEGESLKNGIYRIIQAGWSANGFYYSKEVTPQLVPFIESKPLLFANHIEPSVKKNLLFGHPLNDAVAKVEKAWADEETGEIFAEVKPLSNPSTSWIYEASQIDSEHIGLSIDAYGQVKEGTVEGKKGKIVEKFVGYDSTDFVYRPAAGGKFVSVTEAVKQDLEEETTSLEEAIGSFKEFVDKQEKKSTFFSIGYMLTDFLYEMLVWDNTLTEEEKESAYKEAIDDFINKLKELDPPRLFQSNELEKPKDEDNFVDLLEQVELQLKEDLMDPKEVAEALKNMTAEQFKALNPQLFEAVVNSALQESETSEKLKALENTTEERDEFMKKVKTLEDEKEAMAKELQEAQNKIKEYEEASAKEEWENKVNALIEESGIKADFITEAFRSALEESETEDKVKSLLEDRKKILESKSFDNGKTRDKKEENEEPVIEMNDDEILRGLKANN